MIADDRSFPLALPVVWRRACRAIGLPDLHDHDLHRSGLTWAASSGACLAALMRRRGRANRPTALRDQHATKPRDHAIADALAALVASKGARRRVPDRARRLRGSFGQQR